MDGGNVLRDARSPIYRLNEDCLTALFRQAVRGEDFTLGSLRRLLCLTHVCRAWRSLALDLAELWGDVVFTTEYPELFDVLLSRARDAPLATSIPSPNVLPKVHENFVLSHADRFRRLKVILYLDWTPALVRTSFSVLTTAHISVLASEISVDGVWQAPALQSLTLFGFKFRIMAPSLRYLRIISMVDLDATWLQNTISYSPLLQEVNIHHLPSMNVSYTCIKLPSIVNLKLGGNALDIAALIEHMTPLNPNTQLRLSVSVRNHQLNSANASRLASALGPFLRDSARDSVDVKVPFSGVRFFETSSVPQERACNESRRLMLELNIKERREAESIVIPLLECIPATKLHYLHFRDHQSHRGRPLSREALAAFWGPQFGDSVHTLMYGFEYWGDTHTLALPSLLLDRPTAYPQLKNFEMLFRLSNMPSSGEWVQLSEQLRAWLEARIAARMPLKEVRLRRASMDLEATFVPPDSAIWNPVRAMLNFVEEW